MKNTECVIYITTKHGRTQTFLKDADGWVQTSSTGRVFRMSAEQVLSHILPPLAAGKKSPAMVSVKRRAAPKKKS
ncbi:MAG: hypothetical protein NTY99_00605 [DPANN group archaeon]|nr:hypothetical protein [DPANN group archaeon]